MSPGRRADEFHLGLDGARVRVYQMVDGKLTKIRDARALNTPGKGGATFRHSLTKNGH